VGPIERRRPRERGDDWGLEREKEREGTLFYASLA
jgi:hypothetical protein